MYYYYSWVGIGSFEIGWIIWQRTKEFRGNGFKMDFLQSSLLLIPLQVMRTRGNLTIDKQIVSKSRW